MDILPMGRRGMLDPDYAGGELPVTVRGTEAVSCMSLLNWTLPQGRDSRPFWNV
jgi:hypothetical protein